MAKVTVEPTMVQNSKLVNQVFSYLAEDKKYYDIVVKEEWKSNREHFVVAEYTEFEQEAIEVNVEDLEDAMNPPIQKRFEYYEKMARLTLLRRSKALIVSGQPGLGKSYTLSQELHKSGMVQDLHFKIQKGYSTPLGLFNILSANRDGVIIFDDCDSVMRDPLSANLLKAVLDTTGKRIVNWTSSRIDESEQSFEFTGSVVFLTNIKLENLPSAVRSRSGIINLYMTPDEVVARMEELIPHLELDLNLSARYEVLNIIKKFRYTIENMSIRMLVLACQMYEQCDDLEIVRYNILNNKVVEG